MVAFLLVVRSLSVAALQLMYLYTPEVRELGRKVFGLLVNRCIHCYKARKQ